MPETNGAPAVAVPPWWPRLQRLEADRDEHLALARAANERRMDLRRERAENRRLADDASARYETHPSHLHGQAIERRRFPEPPGFAARDQMLAQQLEEAEAAHQRHSARAQAQAQLVARCRKFLTDRGIDPDQPIAPTEFVQRHQAQGWEPLRGEPRGTTVMGA